MIFATLANFVNSDKCLVRLFASFSQTIDLFRFVHFVFFLNTDHVLILKRFGPLFCSLKRVHEDIFMLACALFNEQNKGTNPPEYYHMI